MRVLKDHVKRRTHRIDTLARPDAPQASSHDICRRSNRSGHRTVGLTVANHERCLLQGVSRQVARVGRGQTSILVQFEKARGGALDTIERLGVENLHALRVDSRAAEPVANRFCRSEKYGLIELRAQRVVQRVMHATLGAFRKDQPTPG